MPLLLDSNALVFWMTMPERLKSGLADRIRDETLVFLSVASVWELEIKNAAGKLGLPPEFWPNVDLERIELLPITRADALRAARLPMHHRDPFDRMIIAQALERDLAIVTRDSIFSAYGVPLVPV